MAESPPHHDASACQSEGESHPYAYKSEVQYESAQIAHGQRDNEEGNEGNNHQRLNVGNATQRIGIVYLQSVAKLVYKEGQHKCQYSRRHLGRIGKPSTYLVAQKEDYAALDNLKSHHNVQSGNNRMLGIDAIALSVEVACAHSNSRSKTVVHHKGELRDSDHNLMRRQGDGAKPSHHNNRQ